MTCKNCGRHCITHGGLCSTCTTILDLKKAGYSALEIKGLLKLMEVPKDFQRAGA